MTKDEGQKSSVFRLWSYVLLDHQREIDRDIAFDLLAIEVLDGGLDAQLAHQGGLLSDSGSQLAVLNGLHGVVDSVKADEDDTAASGGLGGLDGAEHHLVIVGEDG